MILVIYDFTYMFYWLSEINDLFLTRCMISSMILEYCMRHVCMYICVLQCYFTEYAAHPSQPNFSRLLVAVLQDIRALFSERPANIADSLILSTWALL